MVTNAKQRGRAAQLIRSIIRFWFNGPCREQKMRGPLGEGFVFRGVEMEGKDLQQTISYYVMSLLS